MTITMDSVIKKLLVLFLLIAGLHFAENFLIPLLIGIILATLLLPYCKWLEEKKVPKSLAVLICLLLLLLALAFVGSLLGWQIYELSNDFESIKVKSIHMFAGIQEYIWNNIGISIEQQTRILSNQQQFITGIIQDIASSVSSIFIDFILILVYILFLLYYRSHIKQFLLRLSKPAQSKEMEKVIFLITRVSQQYLQGLAIIIVFLWLMYGIGFSIIGVKHAVFFAILCGLLEIIPFIGNLTGVSLTLLVATAQGGDSTLLLCIIGIYAVVQFIQGWVLEPFILGHKVKINPLFTIIALVLSELLWGIPGIFLAIPLIAMFKIVCDNIESLKPYGFLIGKIETGISKTLLINKIKFKIKIKGIKKIRLDEGK